MRDMLPGTWERRLRSEYLKERIVDSGMWDQIPGVDPNMNSARGKRRLSENAPLFDFIDKYFPKGPFAFEPNMRDGRFMFLPENVRHQGMAVCVSTTIGGALEAGHFWYPSDFTQKSAPLGLDQTYVATITTTELEPLARMVKDTYFGVRDLYGDTHGEPWCTFPFDMGVVVEVSGYFMDDINRATDVIRGALRDQSVKVKRSGEGLIMFMRQAL